MARGDGTVNGDVVGDGSSGEHAGASDLRLTEALRADTPTAYAALQELRARHGPSVLAYARRCTTGESAARQLAAQALTLAARQTARGTDPGGPLRHHLLVLTVRAAASWAADGRAGGLDAGLHLVLSSSGPDGPVPPMLAAFRTLPSRTQGILWYGTVEQEPADRTAVFLGLTREDVRYGTDPALQTLGQACLRSRLAASDDPRCGDFRRLIEEAVRPDRPRDSADLHTHMAHCAHCTAAYEEQCALRDDPRTTLAEGLLPWAGTVYAAAPGPDAAEPAARSTTAPAPWPRSRRLVLASTALGVAVVPLLLLLLSPEDAPSERAAGSTAPSPVPPPVTVTATPPSPSPTVSPTRNSPSPSPTKSPGPSRTAHPSPSPTRATPAPRPPGGASAQVVNLSSGLCLDIDGPLEKRTDVVAARCTSSPTQRWRFDAALGVLRSSADPDYCLDSRGAVDRGVGIWECDSVDGRNGQNLRFAVDGHGVIRPAVAPDHAVTPAGGDSLALAREAGRTDQRWRAGAA